MLDFRYLTTLDAERARRHVYYEYDRSKDIYDDATDQVSQRELRDIQKILAKGTSKPQKNRNSKSKQSDNVMNAA